MPYSGRVYCCTVPAGFIVVRRNGRTVIAGNCRLEPGHRGRDKDFRQRRPAAPGVKGLVHGWAYNLDGVRRVLYRLPELLAAPKEEPVWVVAGEKDVESLRALGFVATTNVCGERAEWLDSYSESLAGRDCVVVADRDSAAPGTSTRCAARSWASRGACGACGSPRRTRRRLCRSSGPAT